jgi:hypothetical protein
VTDVHIRKLKEFTEKESQTNRHVVLNAVNELGNPQVHEIKKFLDSKDYEKARQDFKNKKEIESETRKNSLDIRTIHRKLNELVKAGLVEHDNISSRYSVITKALLSDNDYIANTYGGNIFLEVWKNFPGVSKKGTPHHKPFEENFVEAVNKLGAFMAYVFIHLLEPLPPPDNNNQSPAVGSHDDNNLLLFEAKKKLSRLTKGQREYYRKRWVTFAIDPYLMLFCFEGLLGLIDIEKRLSLLDKTGIVDMNHSPDFELKRTDYEKLIKLFQNKYPSVYKTIKQMENRYFSEDSPIAKYLDYSSSSSSSSS